MLIKILSFLLASSLLSLEGLAQDYDKFECYLPSLVLSDSGKARLDIKISKVLFVEKGSQTILGFQTRVSDTFYNLDSIKLDQLKGEKALSVGASPSTTFYLTYLDDNDQPSEYLFFADVLFYQTGESAYLQYTKLRNTSLSLEGSQLGQTQTLSCHKIN